MINFTKKILFLFCIFYSLNSFSQIINCPTVEEIQTHHFHGWLPLYIKGEELASDCDVKRFQETIRHFNKAIWNKDYLESAHCFYEGVDPIIGTIIFAHDAWRPEAHSHWEWIKPNALAECYSLDPQNCGFYL